VVVSGRSGAGSLELANSAGRPGRGQFRRPSSADCRYVTVLLEDIALFDANGKFDGKDMKLLKGKSIAVLE